MSEDLLPSNFEIWFASKGWHPHPHQLQMIEAANAGKSTLLIAPTGGGKTLAGFLPSLITLSERPRPGLHTVYISPLKALAVDIHRNLERPLAEMRLPIAAENRTGDTSSAQREKQRKHPPNILMTTPESLALMLSYTDATDIFAGVTTVILDELHVLAGSKRGDLLALGLARLSKLAPNVRRVGLSATVDDPAPLRAYLSAKADPDDSQVLTIIGPPGPKPEIATVITQSRMPWTGHMAVHAVADAWPQIAAAKMAILFVNTRAQAELIFQELWRLNTENFPIGLHHGSLAPEQRKRVEAAMAAGELKAIVATASLDLGIDWGDVDLVLQAGAPKGASRLLQRIGRANHRLEEPSRALLMPGNRFEYLECQAAIQAIAEDTLDGVDFYPGGLDVLAQHILGMACSRPFAADDLYAEVRTASPYCELSRADFDDVLNFVCNGGYALGNYERFRRLRITEDDTYELANPAIARAYRMNSGTIVDATTMKVRLNRGPVLGEVEEYFAQQLTPGDTFAFGGHILEFVGIHETTMNVKHGKGDPKVPAYAGARMPLSTMLAARVRAMLADRSTWPALPPQVKEWLYLQDKRSVLPAPDGLLIESFPRGERHYMVAYCFEGRNAHQTLGMLLTKRMERLKLKPLGFVATDYMIAVWSLKPVTAAEVEVLFDQDMLGDDLDDWMMESSLLKRTFRNVAVIAGLIEKNHPGTKKTGRQVTINSDLIYEVLNRHEPGHVLLRATRQDAARGLTDIRRLGEMLARVKGKITIEVLNRVSPLALPALLTIGREPVYGNRADDLLAEAEEEMIREALGED
jgi:ATP-dependent Lhr-like helicase